MAEIFRLPAASPTMELGTIVAWRVAVGQRFAAGDVLVDVGTDKATVEAQVFDDGVLLAQLVPVDAEVPVQAPIAIYGQAGEDVTALRAQAEAELAALPGAASHGSPGSPTASPPVVPAPAAPPVATTGPVAGTPPAATAPLPAPAPPPATAPTVARTWAGRALSTLFLEPPGDARLGAAPTRRVAVSPLARKVAAERGVDVATLRGSGPGGRVVRADVEAAAGAPRSPVAAAPADSTLPLTRMRRAIARRLTEVHTQVPTFFLTVTLDAGGLVGTVAAVRAAHPDLAVGVNDLLLLAVARALRASPRVNATFTDEGIVVHGRIDLGFAVALDEGLVTPVIRDADTLDLVTLAARVRALVATAREGRLQPADLEGNTFTVSNLGMFGIAHFTAIPNPPASAILAIGAVEEVPVARGGGVTTGHRLAVTMTCDHRAIDGAVGARFLQVLRGLVEQPGAMLVAP